jgi:hypothetical protein
MHPTPPAKRPIFVIGFQRSGTTLLQSLIGSHPRIAAPPETYFLFRIARLASHYGDLNDDANLRHALHDALDPPAGLFATSGFEEEALFERLRERPRTMRSILDVMMEDFATRHGKARWSEKTPGQNAAEVLGTFPDAQMVHIVRDPRDVIASSLKTPWSPPDAYELAHEWKGFIAKTGRGGLRAGPASFMQIRYEDLTRDPVTVLRQVFAFLGERFDPAAHTDPERRRPTIAPSAAPWQLRALDEITPAVAGGWKASLSSRDRRLIARVLHGEISGLGYEPVAPRDLVTGTVHALPRAARRSIRLRRLRRHLSDPSTHHEATRAFLAAQATTVEREAASENG